MTRVYQISIDKFIKLRMIFRILLHRESIAQEASIKPWTKIINNTDIVYQILKKADSPRKSGKK